MAKTDNLTPNILLPVAVVCISSASIIIRLIAAPPVVIALYRLGYAAIIHGVLSLRSPAAYRAFDLRSLSKSLAAGLALGAHFVLWIYSLHHTTVAASTVLVSFHPILAALAAHLFFQESLSRGRIVCIIAAVGGSAVIAYADFAGGAGSLLGDLMALAAAAAMAGYLIAGRDVRRTIQTLPYITVVYLFAAVSVGALVSYLGEPLTGYGGREHLLFLLLALFPTLLGHTLLNWALGYLQTAPVAVTTLGEPVGASILAYFVLSESPGILQLAGGVVVLGALAAFWMLSKGKGVTHVAG